MQLDFTLKTTNVDLIYRVFDSVEWNSNIVRETLQFTTNFHTEIRVDDFYQVLSEYIETSAPNKKFIDAYTKHVPAFMMDLTMGFLTGKVQFFWSGTVTQIADHIKGKPATKSELRKLIHDSWSTRTKAKFIMEGLRA